ncbi:outer membrane protein assembly factor BamC [Hydromonas duriensis]|uniref:Beta-barrel assembly machine subunit BamC n=1 Tax=Hydromonas duriensis TaxID=1527608 RepID=A0A4V3DK14_9BURK|nr:outer membrane protein assembly factor BamC [Hydromonas duriensis]TDR32296.1 Beta-barrel assembly machine subunit BamC [Hydromonas duriensis]
MQLKKVSYVLALVGALGLSACSSLDSLSTGSKIDYKSQTKGVSLEVPPGLTDYEKNKQFSLEGDGVRYSSVNQDPTAQQPTTGNLLVSAADMSIQKSGDARWLVVKRPAEQVWPVLQEFWEENGFSIRSSSPKLGLIETDWAENRASLPQTGLRKILGKALDGLYDTGTRDMFKTRIEPTTGGVEVYISHRGMEEVYTSAAKENTIWQPRPADTQLEAEFLRRLMVKLGTNEKEAKAALANSVNNSKGATISDNTLIVADTMENAWRRVGLSLDRAGLSVVDRDYTSRIYYVTPSPDDKGIFRKSFGKLNETYQVKFKSLGAEQTQVSFTDKNGAAVADTSGLARVLKTLQKSLK